jgi:transglutaminase superfamily protein
MPKRGSRGRSGLGAALGALVKLAWWAFVICLPLLGAWAASSLAAYANRPPWAAALAGLLLFPIVPLAWEGVAALRRRGASAPRFLTLGDRVVLRTLALSSAFLAVLLGVFPRQTFTALTVRGDWALEGRSGARVEGARRQLFALAGRLEWLYLHTREKNAYGEDDRGPSPDEAPRPAPNASAGAPLPAPSASPLASSRPSATNSAPQASGAAPQASGAAPSASAASAAPLASTAPPATGETAANDEASKPTAIAWPLPATLHPLVASMPPEHEASIESVARYFAEREPDRVQLVKALHDYVADRIVYDVPAYLARDIPDQGAAKVFAERKGVCSGYAHLFAELGRLAGLEVAYVVGGSRTMGSSFAGDDHAWNAVRVGGAWRLVDVTWDAGALGGADGTSFEKHYRSDYLMTPPEIFGRTHLPNRPSWQLRADPLSQGDFLRQPLLPPSFFALGLSLHEPDRSQVTVERSFTARLQNPQGVSLLASAVDKQTRAHTNCRVERGPEPSLRCELPAQGTYLVRLFAAHDPNAPHPLVAQFEVNREP